MLSFQKPLIFTILLGLFLPSCSRNKKNPDQQKELVIAVASNFLPLMEKIVQKYPEKILLSSGASGNLFAQIQGGAPFHLYFSADTLYPQKLWEKGFLAQKPKIYCKGRIVFWVSSSHLPTSVKTHLLDILKKGALNTLAFPNPEMAPYGRKAKEIFLQQGWWRLWKKKLRFGKNVSQTAQMAEMGYAEGAILPLSMVLQSNLRTKGSYCLLPRGELAQAYGILKDTPAVRKFLKYLQSNYVQNILQEGGYSLPQEP